MSKLPIEYIRHIYDECAFINSSISPDMTKDDLIDDEVLKREVVRSLEIIGEATKKIPADIKEQWSSHSRFVKKDHVILNYFSSSLNINIFRSKTA